MRLARGGRRWPAQSSRVCLADGELETGAACRISSPLQAAGGSIFSPPPAPVGEEGGWGLSRRRVESQRAQTQW